MELQELLDKLWFYLMLYFFFVHPTVMRIYRSLKQGRQQGVAPADNNRLPVAADVETRQPSSTAQPSHAEDFDSEPDWYALAMESVTAAGIPNAANDSHLLQGTQASVRVTKEHDVERESVTRPIKSSKRSRRQKSVIRALLLAETLGLERRSAPNAAQR